MLDQQRKGVAATTSVTVIKCESQPIYALKKNENTVPR
jgi:hypothetical protein